MKIFNPFLLFILNFLLVLIEGQEVILDKDFGSDANCIPEFPNEWKYPKTANPMTTCNFICQKKDNPSEKVAMMYDELDSSGSLRFSKIYPTLKDHSVVISEGLFYADVVKTNIKVSLGVSFSKPYREAKYSDNYEVECPGYTGKMFRFYAVHRTVLSSNKLSFDVSSVIMSNLDVFALKSLKVQTNCCVNCEVCSSVSSCSKCLPGFQAIVISGTTTLCEEMLLCPVNCTTCFYDSYQLKCRSCIAGYTLNPTNYKCVANTPPAIPCTLGQYTDKSGVCQTYTNKCGIFDFATKNYVPCTTEDATQYKCHHGTFALIYLLNDQYVAKCGCSDNNCEECATLVSCSKCNTGYTVNIFDGLCDRVCNPGEYYNRLTDSCTTCTGVNCVECVSQVCTKCTASSMYVDSANPQNCKACTVTNCSKCFDEGKCLTCDPTYNLSPDSTKCTICEEGKVLNPVTNACECFSLNCDKCKSDDPNKCSTCKSGYKLDSEQCICPVSNCTQCDVTNPTVCTQCSTGFALTDPSTCCGVTDCQKCIIGDSLHCDKCRDNTDTILYKLNSDKTKCESEDAIKTNNGFNISHQLINDQYDIRISFNYPIVVGKDVTDISKLFNLVISSIDKSKYQFEFKQISTTEIQVIITPHQNIKYSDISITISDQSFYTTNKFLQPTQQQKLAPYIIVPENVKEQNTSLKEKGNNIGNGISYVIIPCAMFGNFFLISNAIEYIGFLYYLIYLDIRYPDNVMGFYKIFQGFKLPFIPNIFEKAVSSDYVQESPDRFMELDTDNYFLKNTGQILTIFIITMAIYAIAKLVSKANIPSISEYLRKSMQQTWEFGVLMGVLWAFYLYLLIGAFLQLRTYNNDDSNSAGLNYTLHSIFLIFAIGFPIYLTYLLISAHDLKENLTLQQKLSQPLEGINLYSENMVDFACQEKNKFSKYSKYNCSILYARKILFCLIIAFACEKVYLQIIILSVMNALVIAYFVVVQPFKEPMVLIRSVVQEVVLIIFQIFAALLVEDPNEEDEKKRINFGWIIITFSIFVIGWLTIIFVKEFLFSLYTLTKKIFSSSNNKVVPLDYKTDLKTDIKDLSPALPKSSRIQNILRQSADSNNITLLNMHSTNLALSHKEPSTQIEPTVRPFQ